MHYENWVSEHVKIILIIFYGSKPAQRYIARVKLDTKLELHMQGAAPAFSLHFIKLEVYMQGDRKSFENQGVILVVNSLIIKP